MVLSDPLKLFQKSFFLRPSLETRSHDRSAHTFGSSQRFLEVPQKGFLKIGHFLSDPQKLNLNILNMAWWSIGTNNVFVDTQNFFSEPKKKKFRGSLRSDFDKTIDQSNVNGFSWIFSSLINKINDPHMSGGPKASALRRS